MRAVIVFLLALLFAVLSGCGSQEDTIPTGSIQSKQEGTIVIKIISPNRGLSKIVAIDRITVFVDESDGTRITQENLTHEGDQAKATLTVPAGDNRTVTINSYQGELIVKTGRDTDVDVQAGQTTTVEIEPMSFIPILDIEVAGTGTYTVKWSRVSSADTYTLEEDDNSAFSTPTTVHTGSDTSKGIAGKAEGANYYYRVCATNEYGNSKWSNSRFVGISQDGTIEIDIPWDAWDEDNGTDGNPALSVISPLKAVYGYDYTTVTGELENTGSIDAHNVDIQLTARTASGTAIGQTSYEIGDVPMDIKTFFSVTFTGQLIDKYDNPIATCDYEMTCDEGGPYTGSVDVE